MVVTVVRVGVEVTVDLWTEMVLVVGDLGKVVGIVVVVETGQFLRGVSDRHGNGKWTDLHCTRAGWDGGCGAGSNG